MFYAVLFLAFSILFGHAVVEKIGFARSREEQIFFSMALGLPLASVVAYASFFVFGNLAHLASLVALPLFSFLMLRRNWKAKQGWDTGFWLRMAPVIILITILFSAGAVHVNAQGNYEVSGLFWQDTYYHVSIEKYFAYNNIVPPQDPQYSGVPLNYSFLIDLYSGVLERLGMPFTLAFALPALLMVIAFFACVYFLAFRLGASKNAAIIAVLLLLFSGSMSYGMMFEDAQTVFANLPQKVRERLRRIAARPDGDAVDVAAELRFEIPPLSARDHRADDEIVLTRAAVQMHVDEREQRQEEAGVVIAAELLPRSGDVRRDRERECAP